MRLPLPRTVLAAGLSVILAASACTGSTDTTPAEGDQAASSESSVAGAVPDGVPEAQACGLLTEEEATAFLGLPLEAPPEGLYIDAIGTANCTWTATEESALRAVQTLITRTGWVSPELADQTPQVTAEYLWELNSSPQESNGQVAEPLFFLDRPGPEGLGRQSYYSPIGLCVLESADLWWCVSAGGVTTDVDSPEALATMVEMAELVAPRIPDSPTAESVG